MDSEPARLLAAITEFEDGMRETPIVVRSPCGRVVVHCDHRGELTGIELSDKFPHRVEINDAELLIMQTLNAAIEAPEATRDRFYDGLMVRGDTLANWKKHPPPSNSPAALAIAFVNTLRHGMKLRPENPEGTGNDT